MADALFRLVAHPLAVGADILGQPLRTPPGLGQQPLLCARFRVHRRPAGKLGRNLDHGLVDQHRHRVQVAGIAFQPQPLRLQRDRATPSKGVVEGRQFVGVEEFRRLRVVFVQLAHLAPRTANLGAGPLQYLFVGGVLPLHQLFHDLEQPLAFDGGVLFVHAVLEAAALLVARIVDHLCKKDCACRGQRAPRPPEVQRARMAMANRFLTRRRLVDGVQRQRHFDQFARRFDLIGH